MRDLREVQAMLKEAGEIYDVIRRAKLDDSYRKNK